MTDGTDPTDPLRKTPDSPRDGPPTPPHTPLGLDYFAANEPDRRRTRSVALLWVCLALAVVPYLCGIVNALVVAQSYSPAVTGSHTGGAVLFMTLGIALSAGALAGFTRLRHGAGAVAAGLLLALQLSVALCLGMRWV